MINLFYWCYSVFLWFFLLLLRISLCRQCRCICEHRRSGRRRRRSKLENGHRWSVRCVNAFVCINLEGVHVKIVSSYFGKEHGHRIRTLWTIFRLSVNLFVWGWYHWFDDALPRMPKVCPCCRIYNYSNNIHTHRKRTWSQWNMQ